MSGLSRFAAFARVCVIASLWLFAADALVLWLTRRGTSLTPHEWRSALLGDWGTLWAAALSALVLIFGLSVRVGFSENQDQHERAFATRRLALFVGVLSTFGFAWLLWVLTSGRQAQQIPGRIVWVVLATVILGASTMFGIRGWMALRVRGGAFGRLAIGLVAGALTFVLAWADAAILRRGYPAFHAALALLALSMALAFADSWFARKPVRHAFTWTALVFVCSAFSALILASVCEAPAIHFVLSERAPLAGKLVQFLPIRRPPLVTPQRVSRPPLADAATPVQRVQAALDLRGQSVLLITVDALRADRLRACGGHGLTPNIDALARDGVVFTHAYTSTPHTSYALTSVLTGTFMRPVMELSTHVRAHDTIADIVRRHGMRTAAFYPPAVFFVDEDRFAAYRGNGFGFETRQETFATGRERVAQLRDYLVSVNSAEPLLVWVHLFEPHEPYEPPAEFARGESDVERYDGEVRAADAAVGELVSAFREARPLSTVVLTADHGEEFGEHGGQFHGTTLYEEQVRVPLVWSSPGVLAPRVVQAAVENVDIAPTVLAALGIPGDARMRGDDLSAAMQADASARATHAFASIHNEWMVSDGVFKVVCQQSESGCRFYDLHDDPAESRDASEAHPEELALLRTLLSDMIASVPRAEAVDTASWPLVLSQAELGDSQVAPALVPLLGSTNVDARRAAARFLGELRFAPASTVLARTRVEDSDESVRGEAAIAALILGDADSVADVRLLARNSSADVVMQNRARRAALVLAATNDPTGAPALSLLARDSHEESELREAAIGALGHLKVRGARQILVGLLSDLTLRTAAANALGDLGDRRALPALRTALASERYPAARQAEERAIARLSARH
ncbi:MAG: sulfatase-like hydrolase/transferase [Sandaracinaceae bacterium]|nr:sulfatase-like hydrolase/transferase [Sandaracinaceae bacterium]